MRAIDPLLAEFQQESAATARLLAALPEEKFGWRPHERSMSLGELAAHVATIPLNMREILGDDSFDFAQRQGQTPVPADAAALAALHAEGIAAGEAFLGGLDDDRALATWTLLLGGEERFSLSRIAAIRTFLLNHLYHHRGQLSTYLRIAGGSVPPVYGPTADESPFG